MALDKFWLSKLMWPNKKFIASMYETVRFNCWSSENLAMIGW